MCNRDERGPAELHYQSSICPHPYHKFHVDEREKTLRPSILFFHILGFESGHRFCKELRHRVDSKVREYEDIWLFLNVLQQVYKRKKDIPRVIMGILKALATTQCFAMRTSKTPYRSN